MFLQGICCCMWSVVKTSLLLIRYKPFASVLHDGFNMTILHCCGKQNLIPNQTNLNVMSRSETHSCIYKSWKPALGKFVTCNGLNEIKISTLQYKKRKRKTLCILCQRYATCKCFCLSRGDTPIDRLYRYVPLWRVRFSGSSVWDRLQKSDSFGLE